MGKEEKLLQQALGHLESGEQVHVAVLGTYEAKIMGSDTKRNGLLMATDRRVVFYAKKLGGFELESYPYASISSLDFGKNMMGHNVTIYASGNKIEVKWINDKDGLAKFMDVARANIHAKTTTPIAPPPLVAVPPPMPPPPPPPARPVVTNPATKSAEVADIPAQIRQLGELHASGFLTDDEFTAKKNELLSRM